jgi:hypothetical protein
VSDTPKRSRRDTLSQLIVILILMAILVGAIWFLHDFVASHSSAPATSSTSWLTANHGSADGHAPINGNVRASYR